MNCELQPSIHNYRGNVTEVKKGRNARYIYSYWVKGKKNLTCRLFQIRYFSLFRWLKRKEEDKKEERKLSLLQLKDHQPVVLSLLQGPCLHICTPMLVPSGGTDTWPRQEQSTVCHEQKETGCSFFGPWNRLWFYRENRWTRNQTTFSPERLRGEKEWQPLGMCCFYASERATD